MRKIFFLSMAMAALFVSSAVLASDCMPTLLCDGDTLKAPTQVGTAPCPPAPCPVEPVCTPAPVCPPAPAPAVCATPAARRPVTTVINEPVSVPVRRKVVEEECYTATEKRTEIHEEERVRTATRKVPVIVTKEVKDAIYIKTASVSGKAPRLSRTVNRRVIPVTKNVTEEYEETYTVPVKTTVEVPVVKTRKVTKYVDEYKIVNRPRKVTTY